ncbi:hypothetical protein EJ06DRAFT_547505 [Trichodelitschia bisporula]|uniref:Uncharacterized protein n=1 Tax=Trichodelitschia bisporula TaxID=703511 RepID=A0A6G1I4Y4_9PEZI|nr:hypothetical protein EJ06DRAFT_547505 [Trichodelitschia bisporula]
MATDDSRTGATPPASDPEHGERNYTSRPSTARDPDVSGIHRISGEIIDVLGSPSPPALFIFQMMLDISFNDIERETRWCALCHDRVELPHPMFPEEPIEYDCPGLRGPPDPVVQPPAGVYMPPTRGAHVAR